MSYIKNNIEFRIVAAKAQEYYKNSQAFMLNEITSGCFGVTTKEILLLQYDSWFQWCIFVEKFCLRNQKLTDDHIGMLVIDAEGREQKNFDIMKANKDVFNPDILSLYEKTHSYLMDYLKIHINSFRNTKAIDSYPKMISGLVGMLNATLFELHEINNMVENVGAIPFVCLDDVSIKYYKNKKISIPAERFKLYQSIRPELSNVILKCYAEEEPEMIIQSCGVGPLQESGANITAINL